MVFFSGQAKKSRQKNRTKSENEEIPADGMARTILRVAMAIAVLGAAHGYVYTGTTETSIPPDPVCTSETRTMQVVTISRKFPLRANSAWSREPKGGGRGEEEAADP